MVAALEAQTLPRDDFEVIIADDGSTDGAVRTLPADGDRLKVLSGSPCNAYSARNRAAVLARGDVLAFTDADCRPSPTWLREGLAGMSEADLVAGDIHMEIPRRYTAWTLMDLGTGLDQKRFVANALAVTANLFITRRRFEELGGFDDSLPSGGDFELTRRAVAGGSRLIFRPDAVVSHPCRNRMKAYFAKVWLVEYTRAVRLLRQGQLPPRLSSARSWLPFFGVGLRLRLGYPLGNDRSRLAQNRITHRLRDDLRTFLPRHLLVPYCSGLAQSAAWLRLRLADEIPDRVFPSTFDPYPPAIPDHVRGPGPERPSHVGRPRQAPLVSVIVPVRNGGVALVRLITALEAQTLSPETFEVVIADDGSSDRALDDLNADGCWLRVTPGPPQGSYLARNRAVALARGQVLAFTDADCRPTPMWLAEGLKSLEEADLVGGHIAMEVPRNYTPWTLLDLDMGLDHETLVQYGFAATANLFVRRSTFRELGGFDVSLPSGGDFEFTQRCVSRGLRLSYSARAAVVHPTRNTAKAFLMKRWRVEYSLATRQLRQGQVPPRLRSLRLWLPLYATGKGLRVGYPLGNNRRRLAECGLTHRWRDELWTLPLRALVMPYWVGAAQVAAWLRFRVGGQLAGPPVAEPER